MPFLSMIGRRYGRTEDVAPAPAPAPAPPGPPGPAPGTQLLTNPDFTLITGVSADGWTSSTGWQAWALESPSRGPVVNKPCVVTDMPSRDVYPTSSLGAKGFIIFSYVEATISQTVNISSLSGINTINAILNIANVLNNGATDKYTFTLTFYNGSNASGLILYTLSTGSVNAPTGFTNVPLTLSRNAILTPNFDNIKSIKVSITGKDNGNWGAQYGPAMDYCRIIVNS